jgi:hypothetical protein
VICIDTKSGPCRKTQHTTHAHTQSQKKKTIDTVDMIHQDKEGDHLLRNWTFEVSHNGTIWTPIRSRIDCLSFILLLLFVCLFVCLFFVLFCFGFFFVFCFVLFCFVLFVFCFCFCCFCFYFLGLVLVLVFCLFFVLCSLFLFLTKRDINDATITHQALSGAWSLECKEAYQHFRIHFSNSHKNTKNFSLSQLELYGTLIPLTLS